MRAMTSEGQASGFNSFNFANSMREYMIAARERGEFGSHIGEFGGHAAFRRQRRKTSRFVHGIAELAAHEPPNSKGRVAKEGSKRDGPVSFAEQGRSAMRAAPEALAHRRRLCADRFPLNSDG